MCDCVSSVKPAQILGEGPITIYLKPTLMHKLELEELVMGRRAVPRCGYHVRVKSAAAIYEVGAASNYHAHCSLHNVHMLLLIQVCLVLGGLALSCRFGH